MSAG
ncbi:hypothetical protein A2U01_0086931, partial [Trifolium medium]|jgi:hypothetical protein